MKKVSCIFLALIIALSLTTTAFADGPSIRAGQTKQVRLNQGAEETYLFTARSTGVYEILFEMENDGYISCEVYNSDGYSDMLWASCINTDNRSGSFVFAANKGETFEFYTYEDSAYDDFDGEYFNNYALFHMSLFRLNVPSVELGGTYKVTDEESYFLFIPDQSNQYNFRSTSDSGKYDPFIELYDSLGNFSYNDDIGYDYDFDFDLSAYCFEDEAYLIKIFAHSFDENTDISFKFSVNNIDNIKPEYFNVSENKISMPVRDERFIFANIVPAGASVNIDPDSISLYSTNPRVADIISIEMLEDGYDIEIGSFNFGKTTIVLEIENGQRTEIQVRVKSKLALFFENLFSRLFGR